MPSYERRENGTWSVRFREITHGIEKNKRLSGFETKKEAEKAYSEYIVSHAVDTPADRMTYEQLWNDYLDHASLHMKESSKLDTIKKMRTKILPTFGATQVREITPLQILAWQDKMTADGCAYRYKQDLRSLFGRVLKYGQKYYNLPNPLLRVDSFRNTEAKKEMQIWSPEEFRQFIACVDKDLYRVFYTTLYFTGMRKGEALALTWRDIDFDGATVNITKNCSRKTERASYVITTPKNKSSVRKIAIDSNLVDVLRDYRNSVRGKASDFVFGGKTPVSYNPLDYHLRVACEKAGVKHIRIHDFRHSHASYLLSQSISIVAVSKRLGHANVTMTLDIYAHMMPNEEKKTVDILSGLGTDLGTRN